MSPKQSVTALDLPPVDPLPEATQKYFDICQDKLGMVPNVLTAHAFHIEKLNAFTGLYNNLMLADSGLSKLEREMIAVTVSSVNKCFRVSVFMWCFLWWRNQKKWICAQRLMCTVSSRRRYFQSSAWACFMDD